MMIITPPPPNPRHSKLKFQGKTWKWASESGNVAVCWKPSLARGIFTIFYATHIRICIYTPSKCIFSGWVTSSDLSILTHSLGTRTPMESTLPALWRYCSEKSCEWVHDGVTGVDGRLQEVVLHAPTWPPQLRHWLCNQQAQVQTGKIKSLNR